MQTKPYVQMRTMTCETQAEKTSRKAQAETALTVTLWEQTCGEGARARETPLSSGRSSTKLTGLRHTV